MLVSLTFFSPKFLREIQIFPNILARSRMVYENLYLYFEIFVSIYFLLRFSLTNFCIILYRVGLSLVWFSLIGLWLLFSLVRFCLGFSLAFVCLSIPLDFIYFVGHWLFLSLTCSCGLSFCFPWFSISLCLPYWALAFSWLDELFLPWLLFA